MRTLNSRLQLSILNRKKNKNLAEKGFTLIELLITVIILGVLSSIALPAFLNQQDKAKVAAANADVMGAARSCATLRIDSANATAGIYTQWVAGSNLIAATATKNVCKDSISDLTFEATGVNGNATATLTPEGGITLEEAT